VVAAHPDLAVAEEKAPDLPATVAAGCSHRPGPEEAVAEEQTVDLADWVEEETGEREEKEEEEKEAAKAAWAPLVVAGCSHREGPVTTGVERTGAAEMAREGWETAAGAGRARGSGAVGVAVMEAATTVVLAE